MIRYLAQVVPPPVDPGIPKFSPNTAIWAPLFGPITNASAGAVMWVLLIIGLVSALVFVLARRAHNSAWSLGGAMGMGIVVAGAIAYGALASGGVTQFGSKAGDILGGILGRLL